MASTAARVRIEASGCDVLGADVPDTEVLYWSNVAQVEVSDDGKELVVRAVAPKGHNSFYRCTVILRRGHWEEIAIRMRKKGVIWERSK